jgi:isoleucyl-tRNA synthetase
MVARNQPARVLKKYADDLRLLFIVSRVLLKDKTNGEAAFTSREIEGLVIAVEPAPGTKCERCWVHDDSVGKNSAHPTICRRCLDALAKI